LSTVEAYFLIKACFDSALFFYCCSSRTTRRTFKGFFNEISGEEQELLAKIMKSKEDADMIWKNMPDKIKGVWKRMLIQIKNTKTMG
jgi:hypothetical protein